MTGPIDEAYVEIKPELDVGFAGRLKRQLDAAFSKLRGDANRSLKGVQDEFGKAGARIGAEGRKAGEEYSKGLGDGAKSGLAGTFRDINGRLRDARGRFMAEGRDSGKSFQLGFTRGFLGGVGGIFKPLGRSIPLVAAIGTMMGGQLMSSLKYAAIAGAAQLAIELAGALAPLAGSVALLPAVGLAAAVGIGALTVAMQGVGDALKAGLAGDTEKLAEAMKNLAPAAQQTVKAIVALKPLLDGLRKTVQQSFFTGLAGDVKALGGAYLPILTGSLAKVAAAFNTVVRDIAAMAATPGFIDAVSKSLSNVGTAVGYAAGLLPGLVSGLIDLVQVGSAYLPSLTAGFTALGDRFSAFIARVAGSGQLDAFIRGAIDTVISFGTVLGQIGSILASVFQAAQAAGGGLLPIFGQLLANAAAFLNTAQGMSALTGVFSALATIGTALGSVFTAILPALGGVLTALAPVLAQVVSSLAPALIAVVQAITPLLGLFDFAAPLAAAIAPLIPMVGQLAAILGGGLAQVVAALVPPLAQLVGSLTEALAPVLPVIASLFATLAPIIGQIASILAQLLGPVLKVVSILLVALGPVIGQLAQIIGSTLTTALAVLAPLFEQLLPVLAQLVAAILPALVPLLGIVGQIFQALLPILQPIIALLVAILVPILKLLTPILGLVAQALGIVAEAFLAILTPVLNFIAGLLKALTTVQFWKGVGNFFADIWHKITAAFDAGVAWVVGALHKVLDFFNSLPGRVWEALTALPGLLRSAASAAFDAFFTAIGFGIGVIIQMFLQFPSRAWSALSSLGSLIGGLFTSAWNFAKTTVTNAITVILGYLFSLPGRAYNAISSIISLIPTVWSTAWNTAKTAVLNGISAVMGFLHSLPGKARDALSGLAGAVKGALSGAASWLISAGGDLIDGLIGGIKGAVGRAIDTVKRAMSDVVNGAKKALGIGSPSKVFAAEVGKWIPEGVAVGVTANLDTARAAIDAAITPAPPSAGAASTAAGSAAAAVPNIQIFLGTREITDILRVVVNGVLVEQARVVAAAPRTV